MRSILVAILLAALAVPAVAQGRGKDRPTEDRDPNFNVEQAVGAAVGTVLGAAIFGRDERRIIQDYYARLPAAPEGLPPGIAKRLARGKPLPPGIAKKALPGDLAARLPQRVGHERVIAGTDILLVEIATGVITDILKDILRH
jgi:hypothetical protein